MIIGIDVGGTHADGVLLDLGVVVAKKKVPVDHGNLHNSIITLFGYLLPDDVGAVSRIHLSTTLCTNAIVNDLLDNVGMLIQAGPGLNPEFLQCGDYVHFLSGAVDHRGQVVQDPSDKEIDSACHEFKEKNISSVGIVTKFSHRNNVHEKMIGDRLDDEFEHLSMGHRLSGMPNFPRRVYTTWLNCALKTEFHLFYEAISKGVAELGIDCPIYILKADGGTIPFEAGCESPCQTIHSGPSASVMGALALIEEMGEETILLDIGGTTTDISLFVDGIPLLEPYGSTVSGRPTLIRALLTNSIGLGGDSAVGFMDGLYQIGPEKQGLPMAFGGKVPTPTDAMVVLGKIGEGDRERAREAMYKLRPIESPEETALQLLNSFAQYLKQNVILMIDDVFSRPVYTVSALLKRKKIIPDNLIIVGGPAQALKDILEYHFELPCHVPVNYEVANAIGAGRARVTLQASLYADTGLGRLSIPEISVVEKPMPTFSMVEAEERLSDGIRELAAKMGIEQTLEVDFIERLEVNTVRGFSSTGKIISVKGQVRPGLDFMEGGI